MSDKVKYELEFILKTSPKVLENMLFTPSGLSEWFADDVTVRDDIYTFHWDGSEEQARLLTKRPTDKIKWQWLEDEEDGNDCYFEIKFNLDAMTKEVSVFVTDFAEDDELEESKDLWGAAIGDLKRTIGA